MLRLARFSPFAVSLTLHLAMLGAAAMVRQTIIEREEVQVVIETVIEDEPSYEDYQKDVEETVRPASDVSAVNFTAGGTVSTGVGSATGSSLKSVRVEGGAAAAGIGPLAVAAVGTGDVTFHGDDILGKDLGEGEVTGEVGAVVEGYGAALGRVAQEVLRLMREKPVHVVWLFDQSESMTDDQKEIRQNFHKVYEELGLVRTKDAKLSRDKEVLLTSVWAFGEKYAELTPKPTADADQIRAAIDKIQVDPSGKEHMCAAIQAVAAKYGRASTRQKHRLAIIIVSDESGDDGQQIDAAIAAARQFEVPVYVMGREAIFGYPYGQMRWTDPETKLTFWLRMNRGPETEYPEQLQWDGLHGRWDAYPSGFGPYEQVRLARETGGIFFVLPGEEEDLSGAGANDKRKFEALQLKEYQPLLVSREEYARERDASEFRRTVWNVIAQLNPNEYPGLPSHDPQLNIREIHFPLEAAAFRAEAEKEVVKAARAMSQLNIAIPLLEKVAKLRDAEPSARWRANHDLILAQCIAYRVRLFQYLIAMDQHANAMPQPKNANSNRWSVRRTPTMIVPDDGQFQRIKAAFGLKETKEQYLARVKAEEDRATGMYREVLKLHGGTPWSRRAEVELSQGFGMAFVEDYWDPRYATDGAKVKLPKP